MKWKKKQYDYAVQYATAHLLACCCCCIRSNSYFKNLLLNSAKPASLISYPGMVALHRSNHAVTFGYFDKSILSTNAMVDTVAANEISATVKLSPACKISHPNKKNKMTSISVFFFLFLVYRVCVLAPEKPRSNNNICAEAQNRSKQSITKMKLTAYFWPSK